MLDEPTLSRQWVVRRLQRTLNLETWAGPFRRGLASSLGPSLGPLLEDHAEAAANRVAAVSGLIDGLGSSPYRTSGLARPVAAAAGRLLAAVSQRAALAASHRIAANTLAEYENLVALLDGAAGVPATLAGEVERLRQAAIEEARRLPRNSRRRRR